MREYALVLLVTAAVTYLLTPLVRRVAVATRAIHEPRARDTHTQPTPLLGGLAMYGGLVAGLLLASRLSFVQDPFRTAGSRSEAGLLLAGGLVVLIGFADDRWGLSAISKLAGQVAAAGILVWSGQALPFMGDIGAMLLGLLLAYGPISSTDSLDPALLTNYPQNHTLDRFPTFLPLLVPAAIFIIPYADLMFAVIRRTRAGKPIMAADRQHLHHRPLNIGHSYRQSVLIMYLWAALFSVTVVSLSIVRTPSVAFFAATLVAVLALLPATMPSLRPWRTPARKKAPAGKRPPAGHTAAPATAASAAPPA